MVVDEFPLGAGALLSVFAAVVGSSGSETWGDNYVTLSITQGRDSAAVELGVLVQSYVSKYQPAVWPGTPFRSSFDGPGRPYALSLGNGAAATAFNLTGSTGFKFRLTTISLLFVADATAGTRQVYMELRRGGILVGTFASTTAQPAGIDWGYNFVAGGENSLSASGRYITVPLPRECWLEDGDQVTVDWTGTRGAADNFQAVTMDSIRWLVPPGMGLV